MSPLCFIMDSFTTTQATAWGDAVRDTYLQDELPDYVRNILGPIRQFYINSDREERELLTGLVEVRSVSNINISHLLHSKDQPDTTPLKRTFLSSTFTSETRRQLVTEYKH